MELCQQMICKLYQERMTDAGFDVSQIIESRCYQALKQIKEVLSDERLNDEDCFQKIEEIVCIFESLGSGGGSRHDFS